MSLTTLIDETMTQRMRIATAVYELSLGASTVYFPAKTPPGYIWFQVEDDYGRPIFSCPQGPGIHFTIFENKSDEDLIELFGAWQPAIPPRI